MNLKLRFTTTCYYVVSATNSAGESVNSSQISVLTSSVACPVCGADGTTAANEVIAFTLAKELSSHGSGKQTVMVFAVIGCMVAGSAGIIKAVNMAGGFDVLLCLLGAIGAFGTALCVYFWRR